MATQVETGTSVEASFAELDQKIAEAMERLHVPGVVVGIMAEGQEHIAAFGVTNIDHPSPVEVGTLFQIGSTTKTVTATAIMRLVEAGKIDLDAPVRTYLPDLRLIDEDVARAVTVRHLLQHTAGWTGDYFADMGRGDDALARVVASMEGIQQVTPLGEMWSYNNAAFYLAGRVIEAVTGQTYEAAARELVLGPLGMDRSYFFPEEVMVHSFSVGHNVIEDTPTVATPWALPRTAHPAGGITSSAADQLRYARFHMGDGTAEDGTRVLSAESLALMQTPAIQADEDRYVGLSWFIHDVNDLRLVAHGGGTYGQISTFLFAPARKFALTILTNAGAGGALNGEIGKWVFERFLGINEPEPTPEERSPEELSAYAGKYVGAMTDFDLTMEGDALMLSMVITDFPADAPPPTPPPARIAFYKGDRFMIVDGQMTGGKGEFLRDVDGNLAWLRMGRLHRRQAD